MEVKPYSDEMNQVQLIIEHMNQQNYAYYMRFAQHFQQISNTFSAMAQGEHKVYQMHASQSRNMTQQVPNQMSGESMPQSIPGMYFMSGSTR